MIRVSDHEDVRHDPIHNGDVVGGERADAAVAALLEVGTDALEALHEHTHARGDVVGEVFTGLVSVVGVAVRLDPGIWSQHHRDGAALNAGPFHPLGAVFPVHVDVVLELFTAVRILYRRVHEFDMKHRWVEVVAGAIRSVEVDLSFFQPPVRPHVLILDARAVSVAHIELHGLLQHFPM